MSFRSGFLTILGRPNAGKSTLLNALVGSKLAIVSDKPQSTRNRIQGILTRPDAQIIFIDTPGIHKPTSQLNRQMMRFVYESLEGIDLVALIVDTTKEFGKGDEFAIDVMRRAARKAFLLLNKMDLIGKAALLPLIDTYRQHHEFAEYLPVSALTGENLDLLLGKIIENLPEGPMYFPPDQLTDQPERFIAAEIIREKVFHYTRQEVPYSTAVLIEKWEETTKLVRIHATIYSEREGQKGILIGVGGSMLKQIGTAARKEIETLLHTRIYLELFVKVKPEWRESPYVAQLVDWRGQLEEQDEAEEIHEAEEANDTEE